MGIFDFFKGGEHPKKSGVEADRKKVGTRAALATNLKGHTGLGSAQRNAVNLSVPLSTRITNEDFDAIKLSLGLAIANLRKGLSDFEEIELPDYLDIRGATSDPKPDWYNQLNQYIKSNSDNIDKMTSRPLFIFERIKIDRGLKNNKKYIILVRNKNII